MESHYHTITTTTNINTAFTFLVFIESSESISKLGLGVSFLLQLGENAAESFKADIAVPIIQLIYKVQQLSL